MITLYILTDRDAINYILDEDIEGLKEYLSENYYLSLSEPITFETEAEAAAFGAGLGYGTDERGLVEKMILSTDNPDDVEIINLFTAL
jgi:hypothetical protein